MSILYRGPSIDASSQVSVNLAKRFQRRRFLKIDQSETRIAPANNLRRISTIYVRGYLQGSENG
jgi:hypothetical protein